MNLSNLRDTLAERSEPFCFKYGEKPIYVSFDATHRKIKFQNEDRDEIGFIFLCKDGTFKRYENVKPGVHAPDFIAVLINSPVIDQLTAFSTPSSSSSSSSSASTSKPNTDSTSCPSKPCLDDPYLFQKLWGRMEAGLDDSDDDTRSYSHPTLAYNFISYCSSESKGYMIRMLANLSNNRPEQIIELFSEDGKTISKITVGIDSKPSNLKELNPDAQAAIETLYKQRPSAPSTYSLSSPYSTSSTSTSFSYYPPPSPSSTTISLLSTSSTPTASPSTPPSSSYLSSTPPLSSCALYTTDHSEFYTPTQFESLLGALKEETVIKYQNADYKCYTKEYENGYSVIIKKMKNDSTDPAQKIDLFSEDKRTISFIKIDKREVEYVYIKNLPEEYQEVIKQLCPTLPSSPISPFLPTSNFGLSSPPTLTLSPSSSLTSFPSSQPSSLSTLSSLPPPSSSPLPSFQSIGYSLRNFPKNLSELRDALAKRSESFCFQLDGKIFYASFDAENRQIKFQNEQLHEQCLVTLNASGYREGIDNIKGGTAPKDLIIACNEHFNRKFSLF